MKPINVSVTQKSQNYMIPSAGYQLWYSSYQTDKKHYSPKETQWVYIYIYCILNSPSQIFIQENKFYYTICKYRKISNISRTNSQNSNVSQLGWQLSLRDILKPGVKCRMKM